MNWYLKKFFFFRFTSCVTIFATDTLAAWRGKCQSTWWSTTGIVRNLQIWVTAWIPVDRGAQLTARAIPMEPARPTSWVPHHHQRLIIRTTRSLPTTITTITTITRVITPVSAVPPPCNWAKTKAKTTRRRHHRKRTTPLPLLLPRVAPPQLPTP